MQTVFECYMEHGKKYAYNGYRNRSLLLIDAEERNQDKICHFDTSFMLGNDPV